MTDNEVQFAMAKDAQNTMKIRVPSNLASRAPIGLNDGTPSRGVAAAVSSYVAPVKNTYAKPNYGGGGGAGKLLPPAEAKASKAEARVRRWHSPVVARLSSWQLTQES